MNEGLPQDPNILSPELQQQLTAAGAETPQAASASNEDDVHLGGLAMGGDVQAPEVAPVTAPDDIPASVIRNKDKAETMAHAHNDALDAGEEFPGNAANRANMEHDLQVAKQNTQRTYEPDAEKKAESLNELEIYDINKRNQILDYSNAIVEYYKTTGDTVPEAIEALAAVHQLVKNTGNTRFENGELDVYDTLDTVRVYLDKYENVIVTSGDDQVDKAESFKLSMFHGATYEVTSSEVGDSEFDEVITTKRRLLKAQDVKRLEEILAPAIAQKQKQEAEMQQGVA